MQSIITELWINETTTIDTDVPVSINEKVYNLHTVYKVLNRLQSGHYDSAIWPVLRRTDLYP